MRLLVVLTVPVRDVVVLAEADAVLDSDTVCVIETVEVLDTLDDPVLVPECVIETDELVVRVPELDGGGFVIVVVTVEDTE